MAHVGRRGLAYAGLLVIAAASVFPLLWAVTASFRRDDDIFRYTSTLSWRTLLPATPTLDNYRQILFHDQFARFFGNSVFVAGTTIALGLFVNSLAPHGLARVEFSRRRVLFWLLLVAFLGPFEGIALPLFLGVRGMGW